MGRVKSPKCATPLTARRRAAMSEMRPVTDKEVRDAAERLRQTKAAEDATDAAGVEAGYELGVRWACEIASYDELKTYVEDDASKTPSWISTQMLNQNLPNSAWAGTRIGAKPCGNEWRDYWKNKGRIDLLPGAHWGACQRDRGSPRTGLTLRPRLEPTAPPRASVVLAGRATSVPFTAVGTGPERTPRDNTTSAVSCAVHRFSR